MDAPSKPSKPVKVLNQDPASTSESSFEYVSLSTSSSSIEPKVSKKINHRNSPKGTDLIQRTVAVGNKEAKRESICTEVWNVGIIESGKILQIEDDIYCKNLIVAELEDSSNCKLVGDFANCQNFTIGNIGQKAIFCFPDSMSKLRVCSIGNIYGYDPQVIQFPEKFDRLKTLKIKNIGPNVILELSKSMNNLVYCTLGNIGCKEKKIFTNVITFPKKLNSLKILKLGNIGANMKIVFPEEAKNLNELEIGDLEETAVIDICCNLESLEILKISNMKLGAVIKFRGEIPNLKKLFLGSIEINSNIKGPSRQNIKLPVSLPVLKSLSIGFVKDENNLNLCTTGVEYYLNWFPEEKPQNIDILYGFILPNKLNKLVELNIGCVDVSFELPKISDTVALTIEKLKTKILYLDGGIKTYVFESLASVNARALLRQINAQNSKQENCSIQ